MFNLRWWQRKVRKARARKIRKHKPNDGKQDENLIGSARVEERLSFDGVLGW